MEAFIEQLDVWSVKPLYWLAILLAVGFLSTIIHELGHACFAKMAGYQIIRFDFGKPTICKLIRIAGVDVHLGLPFGGSFYYGWSVDDKTTPFKIAFISVGGWMFDCIALTILMLIVSDEARSHGYNYIATMYLYLKVIFGISPLTSDGRMLIKYLYFGFKYR